MFFYIFIILIDAQGGDNQTNIKVVLQKIRYVKDLLDCLKPTIFNVYVQKMIRTYFLISQGFILVTLRSPNILLNSRKEYTDINISTMRSFVANNM